MGIIRWHPKLVRDAVDRIEAALAEATPHLERAAKEASEAAKLPNLPDYMAQPLRIVANDIQQALSRLDWQLKKTLDDIPKDARTVARPQGPALFKD